MAHDQNAFVKLYARLHWVRTQYGGAADLDLGMEKARRTWSQDTPRAPRRLRVEPHETAIEGDVQRGMPLGSSMCHVYLWSGVQGDDEHEAERLNRAHTRARERTGAAAVVSFLAAVLTEIYLLTSVVVKKY
eukprot:COSAG01_NODE_6714_length_3533_cov_4.272145_2_plen_132_part_00